MQDHYSTSVPPTMDYTEQETTGPPTTQPVTHKSYIKSTLSQHLYSTTLPSVDKVYHKGYHIHPFGEQNPVLPKADYALPWKSVTASSDKEVKQQGFNGAWLANNELDTQYNFINIKGKHLQYLQLHYSI